MSTTPSFPHKRGDTFAFSAIPDVSIDGTPVTDYTNWGVAVQIRDRNETLIADVGATLVAPAGAVTTWTVLGVVSAALTATWPLGVHQMDIQFTTPEGVIISTSTVSIPVTADVTR